MCTPDSHRPGINSSSLFAYFSKKRSRTVVSRFADQWRVGLLTAVVFLVIGPALAQQAERTEHFVPVDQLDTVFERSRGVLIPRDQYRELVRQADVAREAAAETPAPILVRAANYSVVPADRHALVNVTLDLEQFVDRWQEISIPAGNLRLEKATIGGTPAVIGRESDDFLKLFHETRERFTVELSFSTALGRVGSDRAVGFEIMRNTPVHLDVECPAGRHLLLDGRSLRRPRSVDQPATYALPVGTRETIELQWTSRRDNAVTETLVFATSDIELRLSSDTLRWTAQTRIAVFGGQISRLSATVPATLEITAVESTGLESWELTDDPDRIGDTKVILTWRQPFDAGRLINISGVASVNNGEAGDIPAIVYNEITAHTGRLLITHEDQLRLMATTGDGIRQLVPEADPSHQTSTPVFDYWLQDYRLSVAVRPRDRELFTQITSELRIIDTTATFTADVSVETLNAPLFETRLQTPEEWQLLSITDAADRPIPWRAGDDSSYITVEPDQPVAAGEVLKLKLALDRHIADPATLRRIGLPVIRTPQASTVGGRYTISSSPDLQVSPTEVHGLVPVGEDSGNIVFESQGTPVSGTLTVVRRPVRLSSRTEIRCWMDARHSTSTATVTIDVVNGTTRTLQIRLPEQSGDDLRFDVVGIGQVPGNESTGMSGLVPEQIRIAEVKADEPVDGHRLWNLTFDQRFAGSVTLVTRVQKSRLRSQLTALTVEVPGAIHQEGLIAFEAFPDQQFDEADDQAVRNLKPADPSLVTAPPDGTGRRIARVYQFARSSYAATLTETRYDTQVVPTAVCRTIQNTSLLSHTGSIQRSCRVNLHCIGVQTLRFTLPESDDAFLWSTSLNGDAVEIRRDEGDYLVAIPTGDDRTDHVLELLFESHPNSASLFSDTDHESVRFAIDDQSGQSSPIDVMDQTWQVQYPADTLLLDHAGSFHPLSPLARPGWLQRFSSELSIPSLTKLGERGQVAGLILGGMFLVTALIVRRRWVVVGVVLIIAGIIALPLLMMSMNRHQHAISTASTAPQEGTGAFLFDASGSPAPAYLADPTTAAPADVAAAGGFIDPNAVGLGGVPQFQREGRGFGGGGLGGGGLGGDRSRSLREEFEADQATPPAPAESAPRGGERQPAADLAQTEAVIQDRVLAPGTAAPGTVTGKQLRRQRRGAARLSVRVQLEQPGDYQSTEFRSVGAGVTSGRLSIVTSTASQVRMIRFLTVALVLVACWILRRQSLGVKVGVVTSLVLIAVALVPLAPNQWQGFLDGIVLGSFLAILLWPGTVVIDWIQHCRCCGRHATAAGLVLYAMFSTAEAADDTNAEPLITTQVTQPSHDIVLPYTPGEPPLTADSVFVPHEEFLRLYQQAHPGELRPETRPAQALVTAAFYKSGERQQIHDAEWTQTFHGRFVIRSFLDTPVHVTLPFRKVALRTASLNEKDAIVIRDKDDFQVRVPGSGLHVLDVVFDVSAAIEASEGMVNLDVSEVPSGLLTFELPAEDLNVQVNGRTDSYRTEGTTINVPLTSGNQIRIEWHPDAARGSSDTVVHSTINSALEINDQGLTLVAAGKLSCRQGSIAETELTLPVGYSVRSVEGKNIAGWSIEGTDNDARLNIVFRSEVTDQTTLRVTLFSRRVMTTDRQSIPVPILEPLGASRSTGTVCVIAGGELDVRTQSLSGVSQINPGDAVLPLQIETSTSPVLAWRFNRHPAEVAVRASRVADRLTASLLHGVQLESERQLWTSSFEVNIQGAPRRRLDIRVPRTFLAFEVDCTDLADWYVTESDDGQDFKTLNVQLRTACTGRVRMVIQGQDERSADRRSARFVTPQLDGVDEARTQLITWLGPATEISDFHGDDWSSISTPQVDEELQKLRPGAPDIALTTQHTHPVPVTLSLRSTVASVLCESVTVSNVTTTSIERTLALSWQISRSTADTFYVELPVAIADTLDFRIPGLRQEERTPLENNQVRITFYLQFPVRDRFFASGSGAIPLPPSGEFRNIPVNFVPGESDNSPVSIAGQSHYWVVVNQSDGILEAVQPDSDADNIAVDQLRTNIPEGFLKQSVAIRRITAQQPDSVWRVRFPESQTTTPTVIALAQHVTVLADDGTWRSRHTLQVRNESRQFLPVRLPWKSHPLFCLVKNKPARIVTCPSEDGVWHLIPIPQSGATIAPFEVQFGVAGTLSVNTESLRTQWFLESIEVPLPIFPEYRDNSELGVTVARNTWRVYVPESWTSVPDDDPRKTNVIHADVASIEDTVVSSLLDNSMSMLRRAGGTVLSSTKHEIYNELSSQLKVLENQKVNSREAEKDLFQTQKSIERYLDDNREEQRRSDRFRDIADGTNNTNLIEQAQIRNSFSNFNNDALIRGNTTSGNELGIAITNGSQGFNFRIKDEERSEGIDKSKGKSESQASGAKKNPRGKNQRSQLLQNNMDASESPDNGRRDSHSGRESRPADGENMQELDQMQFGKLFEGSFQSEQNAGDRPESSVRNQAAEDFARSLRAQAEERAGTTDSFSEETVPFATLPVSTGLLSLRFDIPTDGERLDFVRTGGNATLTLKIRSAESGTWLRGILWAIGCGVGLFLALRALKTARAEKIVSLFALFLVFAGVGGWFLLPAGLNFVALFVGVAGALLLCVTTVRESFRKTTLEA